MKLKDELERTREILSETGHVFERLKYESGVGCFVGNYAKHDLDSIVYAYSVGLSDLYQEYLNRTIDWLKIGIHEKEDFGDINFHQYKLSSSLAIATWIDTCQNDISLWREAALWLDKVCNDSNYAQKMTKEDKEMFALRLLHYIQAKEYEKAIRLFEFVNEGERFKLTGNMAGYRVAYAYCLHFYKNEFTTDELEKASKAFLKKELLTLYTKGRPTEMLYWLKTICDAREKEYTPEEVIYTFYEFVKDEDKPDFIKELLKNK